MKFNYHSSGSTGSNRRVADFTLYTFTFTFHFTPVAPHGGFIDRAVKHYFYFLNAKSVKMNKKSGLRIEETHRSKAVETPENIYLAHIHIHIRY